MGKDPKEFPGRDMPRPTEPPAEEPQREMPNPQPPSEAPDRTPDELPVRGPQGPRTPYPVTDPGIGDQPGTEPDVLPGQPGSRPPTM